MQRKIKIKSMIKASEALKSWQKINQGFHKDYVRSDNYKISRRFLKDVLKVDDRLFNHSTDVIYLENNCSVEIRGNKKHRYIRPSNCIKYELRPELSIHHKTGWQKNQKWGYSFHGTVPNAEVVNSILAKGLLPSGDEIKQQHGQKHGNGIYCTSIPLIAELYSGAVPFEGKWVSVIVKLRTNPDVKHPTAKLSQPTFGRNDIHKLYKNTFKADEMQTWIANPKHIEIQGLLIKIHDEKPTPIYKPYKEIADLLTGCELEEKEEEARKNIVKDFKQDFGINNEDQFIKQQIAAMKAFQRQLQQKNQQKNKKVFKNYYYKDDQKVVPFNLNDLKINTKDLEKKIKLKMTPLQSIQKLKQYGKITVPFTCSVNPGKVVVPDHIAQYQFFDHKRAAIDIILALDISGSMAGSKLNTLKASVKLIMGQLNNKDRISLVTFNHIAQRVTPLQRLTKKNMAQILKRLDLIKASGETNIAEAMNISFQIFKQRRYFNPISSILLLSDGKDEGAHIRIKKVLDQQNNKNSFTINTFGLGKDHDAVLMDDIAKLKDGSFSYIDKVSSVAQSFTHCVGGLVSIVAKNLVIQIKPNQPKQFGKKVVRLSKVYGGNDMWRYNYQDNSYTTKITHLETGSLGKTFVLELTIDKVKKFLKDNEKNVTLATVICTVEGMQGVKFNVKSNLKVTMLNLQEALKGVEEDWDVGKHYLRVKTAETIKKAQELADAGSHQLAKQELTTMINIMQNGKYKKDRNGVVGGCNLQKALLKDLQDSLDLNTAAMRQKARGHMQERSNYDGGQEHYHSYNYE